MHIEHEGKRFAWYYDSLHGVGRFVDKQTGALTYLETGSDCAQLRRELNRLRSKTSAKAYPKAAPGYENMIDYIADQYEFHADETETQS